MSYIEIPLLVDPHQHLRDGPELVTTTHYAQKWCSTVLPMPNTAVPLTTGDLVYTYCNWIKRRAPHLGVIPTFYLTEETTPDQIKEAHEKGVKAVKVYPKGKTFNSSSGVRNYQSRYPIFDIMQSLGMKLLLHGEHPDSLPWEAENDFLTEIYPGLDEAFPHLSIVLEHITTEEAHLAVYTSWLKGLPRYATITAHHLHVDVNHVYGKWDCTGYCKPLPKEAKDRMTLRRAATSGLPCFMLGSDSAPHNRYLKMQHGSCPGAWTAPWLPELLATAFEQENRLSYLEAFTSGNACVLWNLPKPEAKIRLTQGITTIPRLQPDNEAGDYLPFWAGLNLPWRAERL